MAGTADIDLGTDQRKQELESAFVGAMDAADTYVNSYEQLHGRLKEAFFELARARYAMGVHSVSPAQFSSQLEASKRVRFGNHGAETSLLILEEDQESAGLRRRSLSLNNKQSQVEEEFEKIGPSTPRRQSAQRQYQGKDSLIASLEEKYVTSQCESEALDNSSSTESLEQLPQEPLNMLGGMVSPHLVQAKGLFAAAVRDAVSTVNARCCMAQAITIYAELQSSARPPTTKPG
ncbi:g8307 [Coccomyxa viridis]|uniref:Vacuolar ATPase assembly protein VMA22 n=1 Tax=Coccomyxa viridis TaxID=1274662 RepID=A0ABP1G6S3_9CHLO